MFLLPVLALRTLNAYRDNSAVSSLIPEKDLASFRLAHRALRTFCLRKGIFGSRFGYLSSMELTIMLLRVLIRQHFSVISASSLFQGFFATYVSLDWGSGEVTIPGFSSSTAIPSKISPMTILSIHKPQRNLTENVVHPTLSEISLQFAAAASVNGAGLWRTIFQEDTSLEPADQFLRSYPRFIRVRIHYWGRDARKGFSLVGYTESQLTWVGPKQSSLLGF